MGRWKPFRHVGLVKLQPLRVEVRPEGRPAQGALEQMHIVAQLRPQLWYGALRRFVEREI